MLMYHHVASYLTPIEPIPHDFDGTHNLERNDVEHIYVYCHVAGMHQERAQNAWMAVNHTRNVMNHKESDGAGDGQSEHVYELRTQIHSCHMQVCSAHEQRKKQQRQCPMLPNLVLVGTE